MTHTRSQKKSMRDMWLFSALFIALTMYFIATYGYFPGLKLSVNGQINGRVDGKIYWDYGNGFNAYDSIDVRFSAGKPVKTGEKLGAVTVESIGLKNFHSHGYGVWLIVDKEDIEKKHFIIEGEHKWGQWQRYKKNHTGRQLKLYPDAKIVFPDQDRLFAFNLFHTVFSGIAKVSSENGRVAYYDGYGQNRYDETERYYFGQKTEGQITSIIDRYRLKFEKYLPLPRQKIKRIKIALVPERSIREIKPAQLLTVKIKKDFVGDSDRPVIIKQIIVNGRYIGWNDDRLSVSSPDQSVQSLTPRWVQQSNENPNAAEISTVVRLSEKKGKRFLTPNDVIMFRDRIYSFEVILDGGVKRTDILEISLDNKMVALFRKNDARKNEVAYLGKSAVFTSSIEFREILLKDSEGKKYTYPVSNGTAGDIVLDAKDLRQVKQKRFHAGLLFVQILTAGVITLLLYWLSRLELWSQSTPGNWFTTLFVRDKRWFFWFVFLAGLGINLAFLAAEWPGSMTPDSLYINREAKWLQFTNHHPYIYSVFALGLYNIFDAPLMVIIVQMVSFHLLSGLFFYTLYSEGLSLLLLLPVLVLPFFSLPVNLFNITFWKDIPYSTLVLFWAFFLSYLLYKKLYCRERITLNTRNAVFLAVLFFLLCSLRFNGIVYLPLIPCILFYFCHHCKKGIVTFAVVSTLLLVIYYLVLPNFVIYHKPAQNNFAKNTLEKKTSKLNSILKNSGNYYVEDYLAERTRIFTASLGTSPVASTWYTDTHFPPQAWLSVREMRSDMVYNPKSGYLAENFKKLFRKTAQYSGIFSGRFLFWNSSFALVGLCLVFFLYRWLPVSAFYSGFFLYQAFFMFFVVWPRWRYLYFIYLGGVFLLPTVFFEISKMKKRKQTVCAWEK